MTRFLAVLTVRNEGAFLLDWVAHHRAAGITDILALSNDCTDGTDAILDRLAAMGVCAHVPNPGPHPQGAHWAALKRADPHPLVAAADWILALDIDEFVNVHVGDRTLGALVAALPEATAIALTWRLFGNAGVVRYADTGVPATFTRAAPRRILWPWRASMFKTLFRADGTYARLGIHRPRAPAGIERARWFDGSGRPLPESYATRRIFTPPGEDCHGLVQLNHYPLGAMESFVLKQDRGRANRDAGAGALAYWAERNFATDADTTIAALAPRAAAMRAELTADPALARLHAAAVAWRHARAAALLREDRWRDLMGCLMLLPPSEPLGRAAVAGLVGAASP